MRQFELMDSIMGIACERSLCHNSGVRLIWQPVAPGFLAVWIAIRDGAGSLAIRGNHVDVMWTFAKGTD